MALNDIFRFFKDQPFKFINKDYNKDINKKKKEETVMNKTPILPDGNPDKVTTVIADDLEIHGTMKFKSSLMIKGVFQGEILSEGLLIVGPTAKVSAAITTKNLVSHGDIEGDVVASEQVILKNTAIHSGNIKTPTIVIESGSLFNGACIMERDKAAPDISSKREEDPFRGSDQRFDVENEASRPRISFLNK